MRDFHGITRLVAEGFRGATSRLELAFDPSRPFVLIFGENGTGKSSIVDAIEFALDGSKGSLGYLSSTELRHLASLGTPAPSLRVELHVAGDIWRAGLRGSKPELSGPPHPPRIEILRRPRLARIVAATPAERYRELAAFVDVEPVEVAERSLDAAVKEAGRHVEVAARRRSDAEGALEAAWDAAGRPGDSAQAWAGAQSQPATASGTAWLRRSTRSLERLIDAHRRNSEAADQVAAAQGILSELNTGQNGSPDSAEVAVADLLETAQRTVEGTRELVACPVCRQSVDREALLADLGQRLNRLQEASERLKRRREADEALRAKRAVSSDAVRQLEAAWVELRSIARAVPAALEGDLQEEIASIASAEGESEPSVERLDASLSRLREAEEREQRTESERDRLSDLVRQIDRHAAEGRRLQKQADRLKRTLEIVRMARQEFTDHVLAEVEDEVNRLYEELHPGEGLGPVHLRLDPNRRASLLQTAAWGHETDLAPQACYSESHLLTLALCLWLALAKRERPDETILVLDDIVFAVDTPHTRRMAALLAIEAKCFAQVLVTTHSRRFLRDLRSGVAAAAGVDCRALRWTLAGGIVHGVSPHDAERLASAIAEPILDRQAVASRAGVLLESSLRQLAILYRRRVPFAEPTEPTLGDLLSSWRESDADRVRVERLVEGRWQEAGTFGAVLRSLAANRHVRNLVGAHVNRDGDDVPDAEVLTFGRDAHALWSLVVCPGCGQIPSRSRDELFVCQCKRTRMRPNRLD